MNIAAKSKSSLNFSLSKPLLIVLSLSFCYFLFFSSSELSVPEKMGFISFTENWSLLFKQIISLLLFMVSIFLSNRIAVKYKLPENAAELVWIYPFLLALNLTELFSLPEYFIALILSIMALSTLLSIHKQANALKEVFLASLFSGIASLFFAPSILFILITFIAIALFRPFELRSYILTFIAAALPFLYFFGLGYILEMKPIGIALEISFPWELIHDLNWKEICIYGALLLLGLTSVFYTLSIQSKLVVRERNQINLMVAFLCLAVLLSLIFFQQIFGLISLALIGGLFYAWLYQGLNKKWILDLLLFAILGLKWWTELENILPH